MNPIRTASRSGAGWFLPLLFVLSCLFATRNTVHSGYPAADLAQASVGLYVAAPLAAAFAAFRLRGFIAFLKPLRMGRSGTKSVFWAWWPLLLGAPVALCLAAMTTARALPNDSSAWSILAIDFMTVLAAGLTGLVAAWAVPAVVAVPLVAVLWFTWIGYGPASTNVVVHNLASTSGCCSPDTQPSSVAVRATLLLLVVICVGVACLLASSRSVGAPRPAVALALVVIVAVGLSSALTVLCASGRELNLTATQPRATHPACSLQLGLRVCLWPENVRQARALAEIAGQMNARLVAGGLEPLRVLSQDSRVRDAVRVEAGALLSEDDVRAGIAYGYVAHVTGCDRAGPSFASAVAYASLFAGLNRDDVEARYGPSSADSLMLGLGVEQAPSSTDGVLFRKTLAAVDCARSR